MVLAMGRLLRNARKESGVGGEFASRSQELVRRGLIGNVDEPRVRDRDAGPMPALGTSPAGARSSVGLSQSLGYPNRLILALSVAGGVLFGIAYGLITLLFLVISGAFLAYLLVDGSGGTGDVLTLALLLLLALAAAYGLYLAWWAAHRRIQAGQLAGADRAALGLALGNLLPLAFGIEIRFWALVGVAAVIGCIYGVLYLLLRQKTRR
jgi:hypothetical protein